MLTTMLLATLGLAPFPEPQTKAASALGCTVVLTTAPNFNDRWNWTLSHSGMDLRQTSEVVHEQWFVINAFIKGSHAGDDGNARVREDLRVTKPDGSVYFEAKDLEAFSGAATPGMVQFGLAVPRVSFDPPDPLGKYKVVVTLHDEIAKTSASGEGTIELVQYKDLGNFEKQAAVTDWVGSYARNPKPREAVNAFLTLARAGKWPGPIDEAFFREVFAANAFLPGALTAHFAAEKAPARDLILDLLAPIKFEKEAFRAKLSPAERSKFDALSARHMPDALADPITEPFYVDLLWGNFLATGQVAPIFRMCELLAPVPAAGKSMTSAEKKARTSAELLRKLALDSLKSAVAQDKLILQYCEWILVNGDLSQPARDALSEAIKG